MFLAVVVSLTAPAWGLQFSGETLGRAENRYAVALFGRVPDPGGFQIQLKMIHGVLTWLDLEGGAGLVTGTGGRDDITTLGAVRCKMWSPGNFHFGIRTGFEFGVRDFVSFLTQAPHGGRSIEESDVSIAFFQPVVGWDVSRRVTVYADAFTPINLLGGGAVPGQVAMPGGTDGTAVGVRWALTDGLTLGVETIIPGSKHSRVRANLGVQLEGRL